MENISAVKILIAAVRWLLPLALLASSPAHGNEDLLLLRRADAVPSSPLLVHWMEARFFAGFMSRGGETYKEENSGSSADFSEEHTLAGIGYDRAVSPSVGLSLNLQYLKSESSYFSVHQGVTADSDRSLTASILNADGTFKIMDTIVLGLRLGYQLSNLTFAGNDEDSISTWVFGPGIAWKADAFEFSVFHHSKILRQKDDSGETVERRYGESSVMLTGRQDKRFSWSVWFQKNPLPVCCGFTEEGRQAYGGALFMHLSGWTVMPGYRYLSQFQEKRSPGSIEDVARHHIFAGASTRLESGIPALHAGYEMPATKEGPSSFQGSSGSSEVSASKWTLTGSWGLDL